MQELAKSIYDEQGGKEYYEFILKKLGLTYEERGAMDKAQVSHHAYDYEMPVDKHYPVLKPVKYIFRKIFPVKK